jgi:lipid-A-disaccharide synthase
MSYRLGALTYAIVSRLVKTPFFALPNILAGRELVPEFIQDAARPEVLAEAVLKFLAEPFEPALMEEFDRIHRLLRRDAGHEAASAVLSLCRKEPTNVPA